MSDGRRNGHDSPEVVAALAMPEPQRVEWAIRRSDAAKVRADDVDSHVIDLYERLGSCMRASVEATTAANRCTAGLETVGRELEDVRRELRRHRRTTESVPDIEEKLLGLEGRVDDVEEKTSPGSRLDSERVRQLQREEDERRELAAYRVQSAKAQTAAEDLAKERRRLRYAIFAAVVTGILGVIGASLVSFARGAAQEHERHSHEVAP